MGLNPSSKHHVDYYNHIFGTKKSNGTISKVYNLIHDISDRRGFGNAFELIDGDVQDEIIDTWTKIIDHETKL